MPSEVETPTMLGDVNREYDGGGVLGVSCTP